MYLRPQLRQESIIQKINHENAKEINPGKLPKTPGAALVSLMEIVRCIFHSYDIQTGNKKIVK